MSSEKLILDFGLFEIEIKQVINYLKQDCRDDWFQDPLLYEEIFSDIPFINEYFKQNIERNNGLYVPTKRRVLNVPKKGSVLRYSLETSIFDRIAFHAFGSTLIKHFDKFLPKRVFNHRYDENGYSKKSKNYIFKNAIDQWKKFEEYVKVDSENKCVLQTDLQNYYENIDIDLLKNNLLYCLSKSTCTGKEKALSRFCIDSIYNCLYFWTYDKKRGFPQNRDISSFLANIYMLQIDEYMIKLGYDYYRYMDDIKIICSDIFQSKLALKKLIVKLREFGLSVNTSKTNILIPGSPEHQEFVFANSLNLEKLDSMISSKKKLLVIQAYDLILNNLNKVIEDNDLQSREFRFYINRLSKLLLCKDVIFPLNSLKKVTNKLIDALENNPEISDQIYTYLSSIPLDLEEKKRVEDYLLEDSKAIYGWQNYLLWKICVLKEIDSINLLNFSKEIIESSENYTSKCGALLYIGRFGTDAEKIEISHKFNEFDDFMIQRHGIIALQKLDFKHINHISKYVIPEVHGMLRKINSKKLPKYIEPPAKLDYKDIIREVTIYG